MLSDAPRSVLVIQTAFIGDVLLVSPLLKAVKTLWLDAGLDVLVRPPGDNLLKTLPYIREVILYDKYGLNSGVSGFLQIKSRLQQGNYDLTLLPHRSFRSGLLAFSARIPVRVGFARGGGRIFHTERIAYPVKMHEIPRNLALLTPFGPVPSPDPPEVISSEEDIEFVDRRLSLKGGSEFIALAPGSVWYTKRWPNEYYIELSGKCARENYRIVLLGGAEDRNLCGRIAGSLGEDCVNLAGETTLRQSVEALRRCAVLVTNDSAPTHLGIAAGIRVLTIFGATVPEFGFYPFGPKGRTLGVELYCRPCTDHGRHRCPEKHLRCLKEITPDKVFAEVKQMIATIPA